MGVFAMFRRKSSTTTATDVTVDTAAEAADVTEGPQGATADPVDPVEGAAEAGGEVAEPVAAEAKAEVVEIPKQQSAEAAADNGAGEGARK
ncbi:hypothetical protein [Streptomyces sp. NPDC046385]|uniref:hypothetical protein n=1 Tax=unclassified Streptomyces TaxID=2593676 RepID=UPI0033FF5C07